MSTWDKAGIVPFNPCRVLDPVASPQNCKKGGFAVTGPTTLRTTRMARTVSGEALALIKKSSDSAKKLKELILQLDKGLQISLTEKDIGGHINSQFRKCVAKRSTPAASNDKKQLSKAKVITAEKVARIREARGTADNLKAAKSLAREVKKNIKKESVPKKQQKGSNMR